MLLLEVAASAQEKHVGSIDFFGQAGLDVEAVRRALPFREGDRVPSDAAERDGWELQARETALGVTGRAATDVAVVCCNEGGNWMVYIGLGGASTKVVKYRSAPTGESKLPAELVRLDMEVDEAWAEAVSRGAAREERGTGYSLSTDPVLRSKQLTFRRMALRHERLVFSVLATSSDRAQRAVAATALGYCRQTDVQVDVLVWAASDADSEVRNNAVRALGVLAEARPKLRRKIPAAVFIDLVRSGSWTDRNKGSFLLLTLTEGRDSALLAELRAQAVEALTEMARWKSSGHAHPARVLLGRIGGMEEKRLQELALAGRVDAILEAMGERP